MKKITLSLFFLAATICQAGSYYSWTPKAGGAKCSLYSNSSRDIWIRWVERDVCRERIGSYFKWSHKGICAEYTPNGDWIEWRDDFRCE